MDQARADSPDVAALLWQVATETAAANKIDFAPDCELHVRQAIDSATVLIRSNDRFDLQESMSVGSEAIRTLVETMVGVAHELGLSRLHEPTFFEALSRLCPLWPFC